MDFQYAPPKHGPQNPLYGNNALEENNYEPIGIDDHHMSTFDRLNILRHAKDYANIIEFAREIPIGHHMSSRYVDILHYIKNLPKYEQIEMITGVCTEYGKFIEGIINTVTDDGKLSLDSIFKLAPSEQNLLFHNSTESLFVSLLLSHKHTLMQDQPEEINDIVLDI